MAEQRRRKGGGGKLLRSEILTVRLSPKLRYGIQLAARKHWRTASGFLEWAAEQALNQTSVRDRNGAECTVTAALKEIWDVDEAERLVLLAIKFPELLIHDEERIWKLIAENPYFWHCWQLKDGRLSWHAEYRYLVRRHLHEMWETIKQVARGELGEDALPEDQPGKLLKSAPDRKVPLSRKV